MTVTVKQVFLSSTNDDFIRSFRLTAKALVTQVHGDYFKPIEMGEFGPGRETPLDVSRKKVLDCEIYVGIIGELFGSSPPEAPTKSYTQVEFETALANGLDMMVYMLEDDAHMRSIARSYAAEYRESYDKQRAFRDTIRRSGIVIDYVVDREEFRDKLSKHLFKRSLMFTGTQVINPKSLDSAVVAKSLYEPSENGIYSTVLANFERASRHLMDAPLLDVLKYPEREVIINIPVQRDSGSVSVFTGLRVHHSSVLGPPRGGLIYHPTINIEDIRAHAMEATWQSALLGLPWGGAKGAIIVEPAELSSGENERLTRAFALAMITEFDRKKDVVSPDLGTTNQNMAWILHTLNRARGHTDMSAVTGKPVGLGGSFGHPDSAGRGVVICAIEGMKAVANVAREVQTVAIQGFGNLGQNAARYAFESGMKVVAVSDFSGGVYNSRGLDITKLQSLVSEGELLGKLGSDIGDNITQGELLTLPCDVLIPAAVSHQLTVDNAANIRAKVIVEGANVATTLEADDILSDRNIMIVPDILANGGSTIVAYFEWVQNLQSFYWDKEEVFRQLSRSLARSFYNVLQTAEDYGVSMRTAAYILSIRRVLEGASLTGLFP